MNEDPAARQIRQAQAGDPEALSRLVEQLRVPLFAIAYRELRHYDNAQDAVANALLRIVRHLPALRDPGQVRAWAARIACNEARRLIRPPDAILPDVARDASPDLLRLDIERELRHLPRDQARASALFYFAGHSVAEIASELGRPEGTVKYWLHRTRGRLRERLKEYAMDTTVTTPDTAIIAGNDFAPATPEQIEQALRRAGWSRVLRVTDAVLLAAVRDGQLMPPLSTAPFVVIGEQAGGRSAFELSALWRSTPAGKNLTLLLLIEGNRPPLEAESTIMAAYVAGFDWLLTRPVSLADVETCARKTRACENTP